MSNFSNLLLQILTQIGGGPAAPENNLVRFTLPAIFWAILLVVAWTRQRDGRYPRERLLLWGFGLALFRELFMLAHLSEKLLFEQAHKTHSGYVEPLEHALAIAAMLVITAAFLRYILDDPVFSRSYLIVGLSIVIIGYIASALWWPRQLALEPNSRFNMTLPAWLLHGAQLILIAVAIYVLIRKKGWLRNIVIIALSFLFLSQLLALINYMTSQAYGYFLCPIVNNLHIWAVPIFGFVYFHEQAMDKRQAELALSAYRDHLQDLVEVRTAELQKANKQLERAAVLEERQRIAAEMHDGLAQTLATMGLKTGQASALLQAGDVEEVVGQFDDMQDIIARAVCDVRRSIASLQESPQPRQSLQDALQQTATETTLCIGGPDLAFSTIEEPVNLNGHDQEQILRVFQEALLNACRHARAEQVAISLHRVGDGYRIAVDDDGIGFDPANLVCDNGNHFGLSIMRARASRINGKLAIISQPGSGTSVRLFWPVQSFPSENIERKLVGEIVVNS